MTRRFAAVLALAGSVALGATAQEAQVRVERGPYYDAIPVEIQVVAEGFDEAPQPELTFPRPARGTLEVVEVSPNVTTSLSIENGRISRTRNVQLVYRLEFLADRPGPVSIGPFQVTQGPVTRTTGPLRLRLRPVPLTENLRLHLDLPEQPVYVGERVPVVVEFWLEEQFENRIHGYSLRIPFFDLTEQFHFYDAAPPPRGATELKIETVSGTSELFGSVRHEIEEGRRFVVISVHRTVVPLRAGPLQVPPATVIVKEALAWNRDRFGRRRPSRVAKWQGQDRARTLDVRSLPERDRPPSFAGAVGRGFALDASADRTVVQVGDPITLNLTVRGEGNLEAVGFPPLDAEGLLPPGSFRVSEGDLTGTVQGNEKRFTAVVRVLDEQVREIPALTYSWFDPDLRAYQGSRSRPIALSVHPARVVGAGDVVRAPSPTLEPDTIPGGPRPEEGPSMVWVGADLAIERDAERLVRAAVGAGEGRWIVGGLYTGSLLLVLGAWWDRRRRRVDPARVRRRAVLAVELGHLEQAAGRPERQGAALLARALRRMLAEVPGARSPALEGLLAECDALSYAPGVGGSERPLDPVLQGRAVELGRALREAGR